MGFYDEMAEMVSGLLSTDNEGGLGQGLIVLTRTTTASANPLQPWVAAAQTYNRETLKGAARGVDSKLVGRETGEGVILATDKQVICAIPAMAYKAGDTLSIDGDPVHIMSVENIPAAGTPSAVRFIVRAQ